MPDPPLPPSVTPAAHRALAEAVRLGWTGSVHVRRTAAGVSATLEGVAVIVPAPTVRWGLYHTQALAALTAAATLQPQGAWEWIMFLRAGVPQAGLTWQGLDDQAGPAL